MSAWLCTAVPHSSEQTHLGNQHRSQNNVMFVCASVPGSCCFSLLHHITRWWHCVAVLFRKVSPNGCVQYPAVHIIEERGCQTVASTDLCSTCVSGTCCSILGLFGNCTASPGWMPHAIRLDDGILHRGGAACSLLHANFVIRGLWVPRLCAVPYFGGRKNRGKPQKNCTAFCITGCLCFVVGSCTCGRSSPSMLDCVCTGLNVHHWAPSW